MSATEPASARRLQVLSGGRRVSGELAGIKIVAAREDDPPFTVAGEILEEDTWLALSTPADVTCKPDHPVRVMTEVWEAEPETIGTAIVRPGVPVRLLAIVHDLDAEPTWTPAGVATALAAAFDEAARRGLRALSVPLLAARYGGFATEAFLDLLRDELLRRAADPASVLRAVWLVREEEDGAELLRRLTGEQAR